MSLFRRIIYVFGISIIALIIVPLIGTRILNLYLEVDISSWIQTGIAVVSFPLIVIELDRIRRSINQKPLIEIGLVTTNDLPFSNVRTLHTLYDVVQVTTGYPQIYFILRTQKRSPAVRSLKIYLEHKNRNAYAIKPLLRVSEFDEGKPSFVAENNFDFVFRAPSNWAINADDIEPFGFYIKTSILGKKVNSAGYEYEYCKFEPYSEILIDCTVWADGLVDPLRKLLLIQISDNQPKDE